MQSGGDGTTLQSNIQGFKAIVWLDQGHKGHGLHYGVQDDDVAESFGGAGGGGGGVGGGHGWWKWMYAW